MESKGLGLRLVATRGKQGGRTMYQLTVSNSVLNNFFTVNMDPPEERSQRLLDPKHAAGITDYLLENPDSYVLGAIIYGVDQECDFESSSLDRNLGVLTIPPGTNLRSLDGQHRRQGLNDAIAQDPTLSMDSTALVIYVEPDVTNRRQMFSDMNSTPRKVSKAVNVAFDHRDPFARVAKAIAADGSVISHRVESERASVPSTSDSWYTLGAVHDALKRTYVGPGGRVKKPSDYAEDIIQNRAQDLFESLRSIPIIRSVDAGEISIAEARSRSIVFSSTTLRAIGNAYFLLVKAGQEKAGQWTAFRNRLSQVDFTTANEDWYKIGFLTKGRATPNARLQEVKRASVYIAGLKEMGVD